MDGLQKIIKGEPLTIGCKRIVTDSPLQINNKGELLWQQSKDVATPTLSAVMMVTIRTASRLSGQ